MFEATRPEVQSNESCTDLVLVVSLWREPRDDPAEPPVWRGSVRSVKDGGTKYFSDVERLVAHITQSVSESKSSGKGGT